MTSPHDVASQARCSSSTQLTGRVDDCPVLGQEGPVAGEQPVMPDTDGDVGDRVGIELLLFDIVAQVVLIPTAVGELHVAQPAIGSSGFGMQTDNVERHRSLDMVPRITVTAGKPRHLSGWKLEVGDGLAGGADLIGSDDAVDRRDSELRLHVLHSNRGPDAAAGATTSFSAYTMVLLPISGSRTLPAHCRTLG